MKYQYEHVSSGYCSSSLSVLADDDQVSSSLLSEKFDSPDQTSYRDRRKRFMQNDSVMVRLFQSQILLSCFGSAIIIYALIGSRAPKQCQEDGFNGNNFDLACLLLIVFNLIHLFLILDQNRLQNKAIRTEMMCLDYRGVSQELHTQIREYVIIQVSFLAFSSLIAGYGFWIVACMQRCAGMKRVLLSICLSLMLAQAVLSAV